VLTQGSLHDGGLAALLETMQAERATGTLAVQNGAESCSLYFLFGHLFHASGPAGQGEGVVVDALGWSDGNFQFDPRAKLPAEETIKSSPSELIANAETHQGDTTATETAPWPAPSGDFGVIDTMNATPAKPEPESVFGRYSPPAPLVNPEPVRIEPAQPYTPSGNDSGLASWAATQDEVVAPPAEPLAYPTPTQAPDPAPAEPAPAAAPAAPAAAPAAQPAARGPLGSTADRGEPLVFPLPSGRPHYEGLKSAFVDFPRLLRTLRTDRHTGYVKLTGAGYSGVILLSDGQALEAVCGDGSVVQGEPAFLQFRRHMDGGDGVLDVIELSSETVVALARLYTAAAIYTGLLGRFVNLENLLEYLAEERLDGSVVVTGATEMGVILLGAGEVLGAYTETRRSLEKGAAAVAALAKERTSRIEVAGGPGSPAAIDVDAALNLPY
jgi:hypothetical protein